MLLFARPLLSSKQGPYGVSCDSLTDSWVGPCLKQGSGNGEWSFRALQSFVCLFA
jgi:hypothetical protein